MVSFTGGTSVGFAEGRVVLSYIRFCLASRLFCNLSCLFWCLLHQVCFAERRISGDLQETYTLGCEKMMVGGLNDSEGNICNI